MDVYLVDGTYELFRHYYALPPARDEAGREVAAVRGVLASVLGMIREGATHIAVATDHVIESFRNELWPGYKTSAGVEPELLAQFPLLEEVLSAAGIVVWPMVEFEADDALAAAAIASARDSRVERVIICTPDKDLAQCVSGTRVVQLNRRTRITFDEPAIVQKFGVSPPSIPDYLAVVGDAADGYPGLAGWGAKSSAAVLAKFLHLEAIPADYREWRVNAANASALAEALFVASGITRCCFEPWPLSERISRYLMTWTSCGGTALRRPSTRSRLDWMQPSRESGDQRRASRRAGDAAPIRAPAISLSNRRSATGHRGRYLQSGNIKLLPTAENVTPPGRYFFLTVPSLPHCQWNVPVHGPQPVGHLLLGVPAALPLEYPERSAHVAAR